MNALLRVYTQKLHAYIVRRMLSKPFDFGTYYYHNST